MLSMHFTDRIPTATAIGSMTNMKTSLKVRPQYLETYSPRSKLTTLKPADHTAAAAMLVSTAIHQNAKRMLARNIHCV